jgi:hypothetical protein
VLLKIDVQGAEMAVLKGARCVPPPLNPNHPPHLAVCVFLTLRYPPPPLARGGAGRGPVQGRAQASRGRHP